jgi:arsenite oxidase large subunit
MQELGVASGDVVEVWNEQGSTHALAYPVADAKPGQTFMVFAQPNGLVGDLTTAWTDRNLIPYYKGTWASVRRVASGAEYRRTMSMKRRSFDNV